MDLETRPFIAFSFIVAPAVLTNASSILTLSTSNRLARAVDQTRDITVELERQEVLVSLYTRGRLKELTSYQRRMVMLIQALRGFYVALGGFATTTLLALIGFIVSTHISPEAARAMELGAVGILAVAVVAMAYGSLLLVGETRLAVGVLNDRAAELNREVAARRPAEKPSRSEPPPEL